MGAENSCESDEGSRLILFDILAAFFVESDPDPASSEKSGSYIDALA